MCKVKTETNKQS